MHIAWIGTGVMGRSMAGHLLDAGHTLSVYNRTRSKADSLIERGAQWAESPAAAASRADVACTIVGYPDDVRSVTLSGDGVLTALPAGALLIDFTTSSPSLAREIAAAAASRKIASLDAPVSGGDVGARNATLSIMVGGEQAAFERARPIFDTLGKTVVLQGPAGCGQHTKMVNQILIAAGMVAVCEGLMYARASGLDPQRVLESVGGGAAASWSLSNYYPRMLKEDYAPGFYVEHFIKDMRIAIDESERFGLNLPGLGLAKRLYDELVASGGSRYGTQALIKVLESMAR
ncbi:MAG: NAD(P)-dependent oxidoreductase [Phycisphaerales bacterium]|nr:NAD(P)-dependent oxidoreductase [Phycisphaerales bacterium]